ncbi:MAG: iron ABC transporter permease [Spirochaetaceae bacterium]|nr:iron ABC transporter permease [Spirochaetaceae bacterium]
MNKKQQYSGFLFLVILSFVLFVLNLLSGSAGIPFLSESILHSTDNVGSKIWKTIIFEIRLPRALSAFLGGGALALSGLLLQTFFRNPLAGPDILGIASGAGFGAAVVILVIPFLGIAGIISTAAAAVAGAVTVTLFLVMLVKKSGNITLTLIAGLLAGYFISSVTGIMIRFSSNQAIRSFINWTAGSFKNISPDTLFFLLFVVISSFIASFVISKHCDLYLLGDDYASSMGLNLKRFRYSVIIITSILTGAVTSLCGPVAFIGIAAPHFCRFFLKTEKHNILIPGTFFSGAILALAADIISTLPGHGITLPLNSVTAIIGTPIVIKVLLKGYYDR